MRHEEDRRAREVASGVLVVRYSISLAKPVMSLRARWTSPSFSCSFASSIAALIVSWLASTS